VSLSKDSLAATSYQLRNTWKSAGDDSLLLQRFVWFDIILGNVLFNVLGNALTSDTAD
jgi:hypothetical protein